MAKRVSAKGSKGNGAKRVDARGEKPIRYTFTLPDGTTEERTIEPLPEVAPWEATPGGHDLFRDLRRVVKRYLKAAREPDADELTRASARVLYALTWAMALGNTREFTEPPKTRRSLERWAHGFLRSLTADTTERALAAGDWLHSHFGHDPKTHNYDPFKERHEIVDGLLKLIAKVRRNAGSSHGSVIVNGVEQPPLLTVHEESVSGVMIYALEAFPSLVPPSREPTHPMNKFGGDTWFALARKIARKVDWATMDDEAVMRAVLIRCGMSKYEARSLTNYKDRRAK